MSKLTKKQTNFIENYKKEKNKEQIEIDCNITNIDIIINNVLNYGNNEKPLNVNILQEYLTLPPSYIEYEFIFKNKDSLHCIIPLNYSELFEVCSKLSIRPPYV